MQRLQHRQQVAHVGDRCVVGGADLRRRQRIVVARFAERLAVVARRKHDVGRDAGQLRCAAVDAEKLRRGDLELAVLRGVVFLELIEIDQRLHRSLAKRALANDQAATVILDRGGEDLGCRRRVPVDHHRERTVPRDARIGVALDLHLAPCVALLDDRAGFDEETGKLDRLGQRAATVVAQIDDDAIDLLLAKVGEDPRGVARRTPVIAVALLPASTVRVERRQRDYADLPLRIALLHCLDLALRCLLGEIDLLPREPHQLVLGVGSGFGGKYVEQHDGVLVAAYQRDCLVDAPAHHVDHDRAVALGNTDDPIADLQLT